ncbi:hypothetical protein CSUI_008625, partial [Cystoisospora suis]
SAFLLSLSAFLSLFYITSDLSNYLSLYITFKLFSRQFFLSLPSSSSLSFALPSPQGFALGYSSILLSFPLTHSPFSSFFFVFSFFAFSRKLLRFSPFKRLQRKRSYFSFSLSFFLSLLESLG